MQSEEFLESRELLEELIDEYVDDLDVHKFVISLMQYWPHLGCCLLMSDLHQDAPSLQSSDLSLMLEHDHCHEMDGSRDGCIGPHLLIALHRNSTSAVLSRILYTQSDWPEESDRQWFVAANPHTDPDDLRTLAQSAMFSTCAEWEIENEEYPLTGPGPAALDAALQSCVAWAVAGNLATPPDVRQDLIALTASDQRWATVDGMSELMLDALCASIRCRAIAVDPTTPAGELADLGQIYSGELRDVLLTNPNCPEAIRSLLK